MQIAIAGGTGMIGTALAQRLRERGDRVYVITRRQPRSEHEVRWDPVKGTLDGERLEGLDAVVNLAGAPIGDRPWTKARRKVLWDSRVQSTAVLLDALARLPRPPSVFVGAGGLGRFGDGGAAYLDDDAPNGTGFLAELAIAWEGAHEGARKLGCRVCTMRMGVVLASTGGAFPLMLRPFRLGIGGWLGDGKQYTSWVTARDAVSAFVHVLDRTACDGGFNTTVPDPPTAYEWSKALGRAVHRPVIAHAPKWALRGAFGELADDLLLASVRAVPRKLLVSGFQFVDIEAEAAFAALLAEMATKR